MKYLIFASLLFTSHTYAKVLPAVFYSDQETQKDFCSNKSYHNENFWRSLLSLKIDGLTKNRSETAQNSLVTQSYLEIFNRTKEMNGVKFMGYIYANASHHLGRIVRYNSWPDGHHLKELDRSFVEGPALRALTQLANQMLSPKLMSHSLNLYKELSWSLASASLCGTSYTLNMVKNSNLTTAYRARDLSEFVEAFVTYEQTYLHRVMYQDLDIKIPAKASVLDNMRYMSFNGQKHTNFSQWCDLTNCGTTSYHLENRIRYDIWAILGELRITGARESTMASRLKNAKVGVTAKFFSRRN